MTTEKKRGTTPYGTAPHNAADDSSTATEVQRRRIVEMLRTGPKSTLDFRRAGIMQSQTRIFELRNRLGYDIPTIGRVTIADDQGYLHDGVAVYELIAEPSKADAQAGFIAPDLAGVLVLASVTLAMLAGVLA